MPELQRLDDFTQWLQSPQDYIQELRELAKSFEWARKDLKAERAKWHETSDFQLGTWETL